MRHRKLRYRKICSPEASTPLQTGAPSSGTISLGAETIMSRTALLLLIFFLAFLTGCGVEEPEGEPGTSASADSTAAAGTSGAAGTTGAAQAAEEEAPAGTSASADSTAAAGTAPRETVSFTIAEQYGLAYAPLQVMRARGVLEERLKREVPEKRVEVSWVRLGNTAAIREAVLGGRVDAGFMGIPPFLIGYDRGMEWRIVSGLSRAPLGLVTWRDDIRSLSDFTAEDRIALPQPGSIQHILLTMACERVLGEADALDNVLVTLNHPDGMQALLAKREISAHFTSPPYIMEELSRPGMHQVLSGKEAMGGDFTFIVGAVTDKALTRMPEVCRAFVSSTTETARWIEENPEDAAELLSREYDIEREKLSEYLGHEELVYGTEILGVERFIDFMHRHGYLENRLAPEEVTVQ